MRPSASGRRRQRRVISTSRPSSGAARATGAEAIHPGYGFLSENPQFAQACLDAGLVYVGPPPAAIAAMGSKSVAKASVRAAGVPVLPGYDGERQDIDHLEARALEAGLPLIVKPASGGGGKGMRVVHTKEELAMPWQRRGAWRRAPLATAPCSSSAICRNRGTSRCRCLPMRKGLACISATATARCSGAIRS